MHDAEGVGLAATQVGILRRFFVFTPRGEDRLFVNPVVTPVGKDTEVDGEGCLSLGSVRVPVERATKVKVEAQDAEGRPSRWSSRATRHGSCSTRSITSTGSSCSTAPTPSLGARRSAGSARLAASQSSRSWRAIAAPCVVGRPDTSVGTRVLPACFARQERGRSWRGCARSEARRARTARAVAARRRAPDTADACRPRSRLAAPPAKDVAERLGIPVLQPDRPRRGSSSARRPSSSARTGF